MKAFDEFIERRFSESKRKAYRLMSIHEHRTSAATGQKQLREVRWPLGERFGVGKGGAGGWKDGQHFRLCNLVAPSAGFPGTNLSRDRGGTDRAGNVTVGNNLFQTVPGLSSGH